MHDRGRKAAGIERAELVEQLARRARFIRRETIRLVAIAKSGHYTSVFSCAEIFAALYDHVLRFNPADPKWRDRDRFLLGKGHAAVGLYPVLADLGFFPPSDLDNYTRLGSAFGDHPDMRRIPGIDFSSGSLGHNLSVAVGIALAGRRQARDFRVFCLLGDAELNEGQCWEAAMSAAAFKLGNLVAIVDRNQMSLDGLTEEIMPIEPLADKWRAFGWDVREADGHDFGELLDAFDNLPAPHSAAPTVLICHTIKGKGVSFMEGGREWHLGNLVGADYERAMAELADEPARVEPSAELRHPDSWNLITSARLSSAAIAGETLADLAETRPEITVLTADLKYSNRLSDFAERHPDRFLQIGIAEQNMVSIAAGLAASGLIPYAGSFASYLSLLAAEQVRTDVAYPGLPVRLLAHHAGFALGFYGTSHHALEDLALMRAIAGLTVICPADAPSIAAALIATVDHPGPIYFRLGRGREPVVYGDGPMPFTLGKANQLRSGDDLTIIATGTMVHPSLQAADMLTAGGISVAVLDMHTISPLDDEAVLEAARRTGRILTVEEHNVTGGLGGAVAEVLAGAGCALKRHGVPDEYVPVAPPFALSAHYRLDGPGIAATARDFVGGMNRKAAETPG